MIDFLFYLIVFLSNIIQTITGFAGTMLAMPPTMLLIGVDEARATLNLFALLASIFIVVTNFKSIDFKKMLEIVVFMAIGMATATLLKQIVDLDLLLIIYGVFLLLFGLYMIFSKKEMNLSKPLAIMVIILAGIMHGLFVSGGALLVIYASQVFKDKNTFRASLSSVWIILNSWLLIEHISLGYYTPQAIEYSIFGIIALAGGLVLGNILHKKVSKELFLKVSYLLLIINGITIII